MTLPQLRRTWQIATRTRRLSRSLTAVLDGRPDRPPAAGARRRRHTALSRSDSIYGGRNLLAIPDIEEFGRRSGTLRSIDEPVVGTRATPVRALFFDKIAGGELACPLAPGSDDRGGRKRYDLSGWGPWSTKAGVRARRAAGRPPRRRCSQSAFTSTTAIAGTGPLRVLPGSTHISAVSGPRPDRAPAGKNIEEVTCEAAQAGGAPDVRPLLLHASSPARQPSHRRVIHIEFARSRRATSPAGMG